jgi:hypothetical protein
MNILTHCTLTGLQLNPPVALDNTIIAYNHLLTGNVKIALSLVMVHQNSRKYSHPILAGICRNAFENGEEPPILSGEFILHELKNLDYPKTFREKLKHLLKYMYAHGGDDFKAFRFNSYWDRTICYCEDHFEMNKVLEHLRNKGLIEIGDSAGMAQDVTEFIDVVMTDEGIAEVEKELPKIPMLGLVSQDITTGDTETDEKINHAKKLFFSEPSTMDNMRSACEALSYVLEPLRADLNVAITIADVNTFFRLVNDFDVRHNKPHTINLVHPEQLEWVFYSLLNTINTYTKLKKRLDKQQL